MSQSELAQDNRHAVSTIHEIRTDYNKCLDPNHTNDKHGIRTSKTVGNAITITKLYQTMPEPILLASGVCYTLKEETHMSGARIVLISRYFHIARAGEKADGKHTMTKNAAMGLVNYVGTRESMELNVNQTSINGEEIIALNLDPLKLSAEVAARPATGKQMKTIAISCGKYRKQKRRVCTTLWLWLVL